MSTISHDELAAAVAQATEWKSAHEALALSADRMVRKLEGQLSVARTHLANISGALCDSGVTVYEGDYAKSIRELTAERDEWRTQAGVKYGKHEALITKLEAVADAARDFRDTARASVFEVSALGEPHYDKHSDALDAALCALDSDPSTQSGAGR